MTYIATICDVTQADAMPLWESPEQPTAQSAYDLAEQHIHAAQPHDQITPADEPGSYAVWAPADDMRPVRVATLAITPTVDSPAPPHDPRVVGGRYRSHQWGSEYDVLAISFNEHGFLEAITVRDNEGTRIHGTYWDARDEILFDPRIAPPPAAGSPIPDHPRQP